MLRIGHDYLTNDNKRAQKSRQKHRPESAGTSVKTNKRSFAPNKGGELGCTRNERDA